MQIELLKIFNVHKNEDLDRKFKVVKINFSICPECKHLSFTKIEEYYGT